MALDVYFRQDIANIVKSVNLASGGTAAVVHSTIEKAKHAGHQIDSEEIEDALNLYRDGYRDALGAIANAFGIFPASPEQVAANAERRDRDDEHLLIDLGFHYDRVSRPS